MDLEQTKKLKKSELVELVGQLYQELAEQEIHIEALDKELKNLKAKMSGRIGSAAGKGVRNPHVK